MQEKSRKEESIRNSFSAMICYMLQILMAFIARTFFIRLLNADYLGINGLFSNILTVLSLAELGVGTAIVFAMYEPVANNEINKIAAYLNYYKVVYRIIGSFVAVVGISLIPFLNVLIADAPDIKENLEIIYLLILMETACSYFFSYKKSILIVYQRNRDEQWIYTICILLRYITQIVTLIVSRNIYLYYLAQTAFTLLSNISTSKIADKRYPNIVKLNKEKITQKEKRSLLRNVAAMSANKIGSVAINGTDNILISIFLNTSLVGIYSNYIYIINCIKSIIGRGFMAITSSVGNCVFTSNDEKTYQVFRITYFISYSFGFVFTGVLISTLNSFIRLWAGEAYLLPNIISILLIINFYLRMIRQSTEVFINAYGIFWPLKFKPIIEAIINLALSVFLAKYTPLGLTGIVVGTVASNISINMWWEPYALYKYGFKMKLSPYFLRLILDTIACLANALIAFHITALVVINGFIGLFLKVLVSLSVSAIVYLLIFYHTKDFKDLWNIFIPKITMIFKKEKYSIF